MSYKSIKSGFSIIEVLIVAVIMMIMTGVLFANNDGKKAKNDVESAARQVAAQIRALQNEALTGKQIGSDYAGRYNFRVAAADATAYATSYAKSDGTAIATGGQAPDLATKRVKFVSPVEFYFASPRGDVTLFSPATVSPATTFTAAPNNNIQIHLQSNNGTANAYVCVSRNGSVVENGTTPCP